MKENFGDRLKVKIIEEIGRNIRIYSSIPSLVADRERRENLRFFSRNISETNIDDRAKIDAGNIERIVDAYGAAMRDLKRPELYYATNEWLPIYRKHLEPLILALKEKDVTNVAALLTQFFRNNISLGFAGLPKMQQRFFLKPPSMYWKLLYVNDLLHRWRLLQELVPGVKPIDLQVNDIGNGYGFYVDGSFVPANAEYHYYYAETIRALVSHENSPTVLELGGGFGGMARYLLRGGNTNGIRYVGLDLPEALAISSFFLMHSFPEKKICLYGESREQDSEVVLWPSFMIEDVAKDDGLIDLVFNSYSLAEMGDAAVDNYIKHILEMDPSLIYHVNHTRNSRRNSVKFFSSGRYTRLAMTKARWNEGNTVTSDEYEFLYARSS